jgi:hypothetical protein
MGWVVKDRDGQSSTRTPKRRASDEGSADDISDKKSLSYVEEVSFRERWRTRLVRWGRRVNPFYVEDPPPVPDSDAGLVPEATANWFSKLTFSWLAPLMFVPHPKPQLRLRC